MSRFRDRSHAGQALAALVRQLDPANPVVLALPRGGVPVAAEVARALDVPLEVLVSRKLGVPGEPELGFGAVSEGRRPYLQAATVTLVGLTGEDIDEVLERERAELQRRVARYRAGRPLPDLRGTTTILVDDGVATGGTMFAAIRAARERSPARVIVAVPVAAAETAAALRREADDVVCVLEPDDLFAIGLWYDDFGQLSDEDVVRALEAERVRRELPATT